MHNISVCVKDLTVEFGAITVLEKLNLDVHDGEFLVLLGSSGCGKSTLLNVIAGLLEPADGQIFIKGRNVTWDEPKDRGIGMVFQSYALYPQMSVEKNLSFGLQVARVNKEEIKRRVERTAEILQITPLLKRKPAALSGGQRQRVAIGRALVREAGVFLFDEPLSNLDAKLRTELRVELKRLHHKLGNTMIYVTHDQIEAMTLADRIAIMKDGQIQQLDPPDIIYQKPVNLFVAGFIGSPAMNFFEGHLMHKDAEVFFVNKHVTLPLKDYETDSALVDGSAVVLGMRPEHIQINAESAENTGYRAIVDIEEPMGADNLVWLKWANQSMSVRAAGAARFKTGQEVILQFDISLASLFDQQSTLRL